ncbi:MAG: TetR/AcrR family transcriptional regulator [Oscillospiraceae bacterium]|nr:TetR/AcrR family transcriptional regulator [Oscillospiraceae bacterium]
MNKQPQITEQTRKNITDAFWKHYLDKPIEKITVREVAATAGYSRATFYEYFSDVYAVLEYIENDLLLFMQNSITEHIKNISAGAIDLTVVICLYEEKGDYLTKLLGKAGDPMFADRMKSVLKPILAQLMQIDIQDTELQFAFEYTVSAIIGALIYWYPKRETLSAGKVSKMIMELLCKGSMGFIAKRTDK